MSRARSRLDHWFPFLVSIYGNDVLIGNYSPSEWSLAMGQYGRSKRQDAALTGVMTGRVRH